MQHDDDGSDAWNTSRLQHWWLLQWNSEQAALLELQGLASGGRGCGCCFQVHHLSLKGYLSSYGLVGPVVVRLLNVLILPCTNATHSCYHHAIGDLDQHGAMDEDALATPAFCMCIIPLCREVIVNVGQGLLMTSQHDPPRYTQHVPRRCQVADLPPSTATAPGRRHRAIFLIRLAALPARVYCRGGSIVVSAYNTSKHYGHVRHRPSPGQL